jgi:hypothetical protein
MDHMITVTVQFQLYLRRDLTHQIGCDTDNVFSSLAGLQFMWQLSPLSQTGDVAPRLSHVPLKQTALIDGEIEDQIHLEQNVSLLSRFRWFNPENMHFLFYT